MRTPARPALCGLLLLLGSVPVGFAQSPGARDQSADACPATLASVRQACGCEPREEAVFNSLAQTKLNSDNLRSRVTDCFKLDGNLNVDRLKVKGDAALTACLSKVENQYPEYRQTLAELVGATRNVPPRKLDFWLDCYGKALGQGSGSSGKPPTSTSVRKSPPSSSAPAPVRSTPPVAPAPITPVPAQTAAAAPPPRDIEQSVENEGSGSVTTGGIKAVRHGTAAPGTIRQTIKASGQGTITTGPIEADVGN